MAADPLLPSPLSEGVVAHIPVEQECVGSIVEESSRDCAFSSVSKFTGSQYGAMVNMLDLSLADLGSNPCSAMRMAMDQLFVKFSGDL